MSPDPSALPSSLNVNFFSDIQGVIYLNWGDPKIVVQVC